MDGITVLALMEGGESDRSVAEEGERLVGGSGHVVLLQALPEVTHSRFRAGGGQPPLEPWERMQAQEAAARRRLLDLKRSIGGRGATARVVFGAPREALLAAIEAERAGLVVMSAHRRRRLPWRPRGPAPAGDLPVPVVLVAPAEPSSRRPPRLTTRSSAA